MKNSRHAHLTERPILNHPLPLDPRGGIAPVIVIEEPDLSGGERIANLGHPFLPLLLADHGNLVQIAKVPGRELRVLPQGGQFPAVEIAHVEENADLTVLLDEPIHFGNECFVVLLRQLVADDDLENPTFCFFREFNSHGIEMVKLRCEGRLGVKRNSRATGASDTKNLSRGRNPVHD